MFYYNFNLTIYMFLLSCLMFSFFFKHLLLALISLEFVMMNLTYNIFLNLMMTNMNFFFLSIFLTMFICESILGLSLLIFLVRLTGNDYYKSLNLMKW